MECACPDGVCYANHESSRDVEEDFIWDSNKMELTPHAHHWNQYPSSLPLSFVDKILLYRFEIMTPRMPHTAEVSNPFIESWFPLSLTDAPAFSALIVSSMTHRRTLSLISANSMASFRSEEQKILENYYVELVRILNKILKDPTTAVTDATILAVFMMIEMPVLSVDKDWAKESPFHAPLQGLQWLNIHGAREPNLSHQRGLCKLVELKGGLHNIELPGLAAAISYRVLVNATLALSTPQVPFFPLSGNPNLELCDIISSSPDGIQFQLSTLYLTGMTRELIEVFQATAAYNLTLRKYISGEIVRMDNQTMCDWRNLLQHNIVSLPSAQVLMDTSGLYEVCRISLLIYSIGVTFPLPGVGAPFIPLMRELKAQLQILDVHSILSMVPESATIIQWALTMGCIAATDSIERSWFVGALSQYIVFAQISEWNQFKQELKKVLWLDSACDMAGKLLWKEMQMLNEFEEPAAQSQSSKTPLDFIKNDTPCGNCRTRKIKCDKRLPCQNCTKGGYLCTSSIATDDSKPPRVHLYSSRKKPCELCRQRKVKCDKQRPCHNCAKGSFTCSYV